MTDRLVSEYVDAEDVADILLSLATLMEAFHQSDIALQGALSNLSSGTAPSTEVLKLQHIDLITQTHCDLARLLPILAASARGAPIQAADLKSALTLRSLQDSLIDGSAESAEEIAAGEVSLF